MEVFSVFLYVLVVVISLLLIGIILVQPSKSGGMGSAFGGLGESVFGGQVGSHLTKVTVIMTASFFLLTLILASVIGRGLQDESPSNGIVKALEKKADEINVQTTTPKIVENKKVEEAKNDKK